MKKKTNILGMSLHDDPLFMASLSTINNCKHAKKNSVQCDFNYSQISKTSLIAKILSTHLLITLIYYITHSQGCPEGFAGGGGVWTD